MPANNATRCMAPAAPVFAAKAAPTGTVQTSSFTQFLQKITHLRELRYTQSTQGGPGWGQSMEPTIKHRAPLIVYINARGFVGDGIYLFY